MQQTACATWSHSCLPGNPRYDPSGAPKCTVFRKLKPLDYLTSYSHRGRYYTLREIVHFDDKGLWSQTTV